jgi:UDP-glucose 4-epimerase
MTSKKIVVTGGAGFIGSHLVDLLLKEGHNVIVWDDFSYGKRSYLDVKDPKLTILEGDITQADFVNSAMQQFDPEIIFHLAALHHIPTCENNPDVALRINVEGTQHILNAAAKLSLLQRIVFASSGAVYDIVNDPLQEDETPTIPYDVYSVSKLCGEYLMRLWANKYNKQVLVARIFNTIGGRETNAHLVPEIVQQLLEGKTTIELGNLEPKRSYIDVRDTSAGLFALGFCNHDQSFDVINLGREDEYNVKEIVEMLQEAHGSPIQIQQSAARMRKVDRIKQQASMNKMNRIAGWQPQYTVKEGIAYAYRFDKEKRIR